MREVESREAEMGEGRAAPLYVEKDIRKHFVMSGETA